MLRAKRLFWGLIIVMGLSFIAIYVRRNFFLPSAGIRRYGYFLYQLTHNDQHFADPRQHQYRQGVVDHRLVIKGEYLLGDRAGNGIESGAGASGEY